MKDIALNIDFLDKVVLEFPFLIKSHFFQKFAKFENEKIGFFFFILKSDKKMLFFLIFSALSLNETPKADGTNKPDVPVAAEEKKKTSEEKRPQILDSKTAEKTKKVNEIAPQKHVTPSIEEIAKKEEELKEKLKKEVKHVDKSAPQMPDDKKETKGETKEKEIQENIKSETPRKRPISKSTPKQRTPPAEEKPETPKTAEENSKITKETEKNSKKQPEIAEKAAKGAQKLKEDVKKLEKAVKEVEKDQKEVQETEKNDKNEQILKENENENVFSGNTSVDVSEVFKKQSMKTIISLVLLIAATFYFAGYSLVFYVRYAYSQKTSVTLESSSDGNRDESYLLAKRNKQ